MLLDRYLSGRAFAPEHPVVHFNDLELRYASLLGHVDALAARLQDEVGPGARVALVLPSDPTFVWGLLACIRADCEPILLNPLAGAAGVQAALKRTAADLSLGGVGRSADITLTGDELREMPPTNCTPRAPAGRLRAVSLSTSGSSGTAKTVRLPYETLTSALSRHLEFGREAGDWSITTIVKPLFHMSGIWNLLAAVALGRELVLQEKFNAREFAELAARHRLRRVNLSTSMMISLLEDADNVRSSLATLEIAQGGAMALNLDVVHRFESEFDCVVLDAFGQTETCGEVAGWVPRLVHAVGADSPRRAATGQVFPGVEVKILRGDGTLGDDGEGEICIRSKGFVQTINDVPILEVSGDGYHHMGDIGYVDEDRLLFITGRVSRVINRGGFNVYPEAIERSLAANDAVAEAIVIPVDDPRLGEVPVALITAKRGKEPDIAALAESLRNEFGPHIAPKVILEVSQMPRLATGKLDLDGARRYVADPQSAHRTADGRTEAKEALL